MMVKTMNDFTGYLIIGSCIFGIVVVFFALMKMAARDGEGNEKM